MDTQNFEEKLRDMSKPEINMLRHQDLLANAIANAKDSSVVSWWWLSIPLYLIAMLLMKSFFMPQTTLISNIHDLTSQQKISSMMFFLILPFVFIVINIFNIRKVYFLSGNPKNLQFLKTVWFNLIIIFLSILVLIIYSL